VSSGINKAFREAAQRPSDVEKRGGSGEKGKRVKSGLISPRLIGKMLFRLLPQ